MGSDRRTPCPHATLDSLDAHGRSTNSLMELDGSDKLFRSTVDGINRSIPALDPLPYAIGYDSLFICHVT